MKQIDAPDKFPIPWANNAGVLYVRDVPAESQIGTVDGAASLEDGWVPLNFVDRELGGIPPSGLDDNGVKRQITANLRWYSAGMVPKYDSVFSSSIGGYPKGAILQRSDEIGYWRSTVDDNLTDPDSGGAGWSPMTITSVNDPQYNNDSHTSASTSWVRRAMSKIMISLGFDILLSLDGYIKLPSCLGGLIVQWGSQLSGVSGTQTYNFPMPFPVNILQIWTTPFISNQTNHGATVINSRDKTSVTWSGYYSSPGAPMVKASTENVRATILAIGY